MLKCCSFTNLASFFDKFLDLLFWKYFFFILFSLLFQAGGQLDTHTQSFLFACFKLINFVFAEVQKVFRYMYGHVLFSFSMLFALNVCDGSVFVFADLFLLLNLSVCWVFHCFTSCYVNVFVWVKLNCYCFPRCFFYLWLCEWVSEWSSFILKNIISLFFMMTLNACMGFVDVFPFYYL